MSKYSIDPQWGPLIDKTNCCEPALRVTIADTPTPEYDYEIVCASNDGGATTIKAILVVDNTTNPPVSTLYDTNNAVLTGYTVVECPTTIDREEINICKQNSAGKWQVISFINVDDANDIVGPIFVNPNGVISTDPGDLVNCADTIKTITVTDDCTGTTKNVDTTQTVEAVIDQVLQTTGCNDDRRDDLLIEIRDAILADTVNQTTLLNNIITELQGIDANTDELEARLQTLIDNQTTDNASIIAELQDILIEAQAINANTDTLEALISDSIDRLDTLIAEQDKENIITSYSQFHIGTDNFYSRQERVYDSETASIVSTETQYSTDGVNWTATTPVGTPIIGWYESPTVSLASIDCSVDDPNVKECNSDDILAELQTANANLEDAIIELQAINGNTDNLETLITASNTKLDTVISELQTANTTLDSIQADTSAISTSIGDVITELQDINTLITSGNASLTSIDGKLTTANTSLADILTQVQAVNANTDTIETLISNSITAITDLQTIVQNEFDETQVILSDILTELETPKTQSVSEVEVCDGTDTLIRKTVVLSDGTETVSFYTTDGTITTTPVTYTIGACSIPAPSTQEEVLIDMLPTGEQIKFIRRFVINGNGTTGTVIDLELDGTTAYTTLGTVQHTYSRENAGFESIAITDVSVVTLSSIPTGSNFAELIFKSTDIGGAIAYNETLGASTPLSDGSTGYLVNKNNLFTLQGRDELENFSAIALTGFSGTLEVRYKFDYKVRD